MTIQKKQILLFHQLTSHDGDGGGVQNHHGDGDGGGDDENLK